jgi:hypothetical protein
MLSLIVGRPDASERRPRVSKEENVEDREPQRGDSSQPRATPWGKRGIRPTFAP